MSDSFPLRGLYSLWNSPDENTAVGSVSLLQGIFPTQGLNPGVPRCRRILYQLSLVGSHFWYSHVGVLWCLGLDYLPSPKISIDIYFCQLLTDTNTWLRYNLQTIKCTAFTCSFGWVLAGWQLMCAKSLQSYLCDPIDRRLHGILQARKLEWVAIPFSTGFSWPRDWTWVSCIVGTFLPSEPPGKPCCTLYSQNLFF